MNNICVVHPKVCKESAKYLADELGCPRFNPYKTEIDTDKFDIVFNFGCSKNLTYKKVINKPSSVSLCNNKIETYKKLQEAGIPTVSYVTEDKAIPKSWSWVVCREKVNSRNCEGVLITKPDEITKGLPLYTKYIPHKDEYRIVVFMGKVVARYKRGEVVGGFRNLILMHKQGFSEVDKACVLACKALDIDYAGLDVLWNETYQKYYILEANSGGVLTEDVAPHIVRYIKGL
jgi:hypothetical protein